MKKKTHLLSLMKTPIVFYLWNTAAKKLHAWRKRRRKCRKEKEVMKHLASSNSGNCFIWQFDQLKIKSLYFRISLNIFVVKNRSICFACLLHESNIMEVSTLRRTIVKMKMCLIWIKCTRREYHVWIDTSSSDEEMETEGKWPDIMMAKDVKLIWQNKQFSNTDRLNSSNIFHITLGPTLFSIAQIEDKYTAFEFFLMLLLMFFIIWKLWLWII